MNINYNNQFGKHTIFGNAGAFISGEKSSAYRHTAEGFPNNQKADISFAKQYAENSTPTGYSTINREASFLLAASYDYDNRYLADATVRKAHLPYTVQITVGPIAGLLVLDGTCTMKPS